MQINNKNKKDENKEI